MNNKINKFTPEKQISNEDLKEKINKLIDDNIIPIKEILELIPNEDNGKQFDIRTLYSNLCLDEKNKKFKTKFVNLETSFFDKVNNIALEECIYFLNKNNYLSAINEDEDKALNILDILYKYRKPQIELNLKIVPNQKGKLCKYDELYDENEFNQNFKKMLKNHFNYDISIFLIHKKLKLETINKYSINENLIQTIKNSFLEKDKYSKIFSQEYITNYNVIKAKELIKFYPKNEKENEDNIVKKFIKSYKAISGEKINEEEIDTMNISLWEKTIEILCN